ncbi:MAG: TolC family protein [Alphaproteobacteria bacterium]
MRLIHGSIRVALHTTRACAECLRRLTAFVAAIGFIVAVTAAQPVAGSPFDSRATISAQDLVEAVLSRNFNLPARAQALEAARARAARAGALDDPMFSYGLAPGLADRSSNIFGQQLELSQQLPWPGKLALREQAARHEAEASHSDVASLRLDLAEQAHALFADWFLVHRATHINESNQKLWQDVADIAERRYEVGRALQSDVLQARIEFHRLKQSHIALERERRNIQAEINALLGQAPDTPLPAPADLPSPEPANVQVAAPGRAVAGQPALARLKAEIAAAESKVGLADLEFYPDFSVRAGYNGVMDMPEQRGMVGITLNIPFDQGKRRAARDEAKAELRSLEAQLSDRQIALQAELQKAVDRAEEGRRMLSVFNEQLLPLAEQNINAVLSGYQSGGGDFLALLTAQKARADIEYETAAALADYHRSLARIERLTAASASAEPTLKQSGEME